MSRLLIELFKIRPSFEVAPVCCVCVRARRMQCRNYDLVRCFRVWAFNCLTGALNSMQNEIACAFGATEIKFYCCQHFCTIDSQLDAENYFVFYLNVKSAVIRFR